MDGNFSSGAVLPALVGLVTGVAFFVLIGYTMDAAHIMRYVPPADLDEFDTPDKLQEVKFLSDKYQDDLLKGFGRSDNKIIQFYYEVGKVVDTNNDGYQEVLHHLELRLTYDESNGPIEDNNNRGCSRCRRGVLHSQRRTDGRL